MQIIYTLSVQEGSLNAGSCCRHKGIHTTEKIFVLTIQKDDQLKGRDIPIDQE